MTTDLDALYDDVILDHNRHPRNFRRLETGHHATGYNPLCGDRVTVYLRLDEGVIQEAAFHGVGCAIAMASASLMTESVRGKPVADAGALRDVVRRLVTGTAAAEPTGEAGALLALAGVRQYPVRAKCALLAWETLQAAVAGDEEPVTTERSRSGDE
jgi:nitrogen fixation protein NifU and related proteins